MKKARDINFWRNEVKMLDEKGELVRDMADVRRIANHYGAGESYINDQLQALDIGTQKRFQDLWAELKKTRELKPDISDKEIIPQLLEKHNIGQKIWDTAGWPMRKSEYYNRTYSWLAHYAKARETFAANSFTYDWDDPWLIQMANRGVQGTQFLYNNASRALFASTDVGKTLTRLMQFTFQSLRMRKGIAEQAKEAGFRSGSEEMKRLERLLVADMTMLGLATIFPASLFNANLGQPWQWFTDLADFFFGADQDKERAFYGTLPYPANIIQPISPPVTRYFFPVFNSLLSNDWGKLFDRQIWSWFPFGRVAYDAKKVYENPAMIVERSTGIPIHSIATQAKKERPRQQVLEGAITGLLP